MSTVSEVKGLEDLISKLNSLPEKLEKKVLRAAIRKGANIIRDKARAYVPVDTGELRKSITVSGAKYRKGTIALSIKPRKNKKRGISVFYGKFIEYGTSKMAAKPFMRPAYDEAEKEVLDVVINDIKSKVNEVAK